MTAALAADVTASNAALRRYLHGLPAVDQVGADGRAAMLSTRSIKAASKEQAIDLAISMVDLTTLEGMDTPGKVRALCAKVGAIISFKFSKNEEAFLHYHFRSTFQHPSYNFLEVKGNTLRQRESFSVIYGIGLTAHISFPGIRTTFSTTASFLFSTKSAAYFSATGSNIDIGDTTI